MTSSIRRHAALAAGGMGVVVACGLGFLVWDAWHAARVAAAVGDDAAATEFRFLAAMLVVTLVFLLGIAALLASHVSAMIANPLRELRDGLVRIRHSGPHERIVPDGPEEVQQVAAEVNALATTLANDHDRFEKMVEMRTIDALMFGVAHEVHTPLTTLILDNHLLARRLRRLIESPALPAALLGEAEQGLRTVERSRTVHERLERLTRSLREAVRADEPERQRDINLIVGAAVALAHHRAPGDVRVETHFGATRPIDCVATEVFHAAHGLILQAAADVDPQGIIHVSTGDSVDGVIMTVRYSGRPVAAEVLEVLDDPGLSDEDFPSLPLKTVQRFVMKGGGTLDYDSGTGDGAGWRVRLPAARPPA